MIKGTTKIKLDNYIEANYIKIEDIAKKIFKDDYKDDLQETIIILYSIKNNLLNDLIDNNELIYYIVRIFKNRRFIKVKGNKLKRNIFEEDSFNCFDTTGKYGFNYQIDKDEFINRLKDEEDEIKEFENILYMIKLRCTKSDGRYFLDKVLKYYNKTMMEFTKKNGLNYQNTNNAYLRVLRIIRTQLKINNKNGKKSK